MITHSHQAVQDSKPLGQQLDALWEKKENLLQSNPEMQAEIKEMITFIKQLKKVKGL